MSIHLHSLVSLINFKLSSRLIRRIPKPSLQDIYTHTSLSLSHLFGESEISSLQVKHISDNLYNISITMVHPTTFYKHKDTLLNILHSSLNNTDFSFEVKTSIKPYER